MGKGNKTTTTQQQQNTQSTALDPVIQQQAYKNLNDATNVADGYQAVTQQAPAGFSGDQQAGFDAARGAGSAGDGTLQSGIDAAKGVATYQPLDVNGAGYNAQGYNSQGYGAQGYDAAKLGPQGGYTAAQTGPAVSASSQGYDAAQAQNAQGYDAATAQGVQLNRGNIGNVATQGADQAFGGYLNSFNPAYQSDVIDASTHDLNRARLLAQQGTAAAAARQGAFGGSRQGVADGETNDAFLRAVAANSANLRQGGFNTALNSFQTDQARQLDAQKSNQGADVTATTTNANLGQQANLQNAQFANQAKQYTADQANQFTLHNTDAQNQARAFGASAANAAALASAQAQNSINLDNTAAKNTAGQFNSNLSLQGALANQASQNAAGQFNATQGNTANQFNAASANQAGQFNSTAQNQAGQFNAGEDQAAQTSNQGAHLNAANLNLQGANTLTGQAGQQQSNAYNHAQALLGIGGQQQQQQQNAQDVAYQNAVAQQQAPITALGIKQSALGLTPYGTTTTGSGSSSGTQTQSLGLGSSLMGLVGGGLQIAGGINSAFAPNTVIGNAVKSDERLKENINPMKNPMTAIHKMKGVNYDWKPGHAPAGLGFPSKGAKPVHDAGLLAQDVGAAMPGAAKEIGGAMHYSGPAVLGLLVEGMKHLDKKVSGRRG